MKRSKRLAAALLAVVMGITMFASCGGSNEIEPTPSLKLTVCSNYVSEETLAPFTESVFAAYPDWQTAEVPVEIEPMAMGDEKADGMAYGAAVMQISAMAMTGELDVMITGGLNAAREARSETFYTLEEIFTEEEIAAFGDRLLSYEVVDTDGNPTGEMTPAVGVKLDSEYLDSFFGDDDYGVFIVCTTTHPTEAKEVFLALAGQE